MQKNVLCIVQARLNSTRLPGKVLLPLKNRPVIEHVFNQLSFATKLNNIILATSTEESDNKLEVWAINNSKEIFRGNLNDVLERYYFAAKKYNGDIIVRITGDCPLIDPKIVDTVVNEFVEGGFDYFSNTINPTFPDGLDTEVFSYDALETTYFNAKLKSEREHVTPYIKNNPGTFKLGGFENKVNYEKYRWTIDNQEDYEFLKIIFEKLYIEDQYISWKDVIRFIDDKPEIININKHIKRNEGYEKSLIEDNL